MLAERLLDELRAIVGPEDVLWKRADLQTYEYDGYVERSLPEAVVFVESTDEVTSVVRVAYRENLPFLPRGCATNLTGGTIAVRGGLIIEMARMSRVVEIDTANERMIVEAGIYNLEVSTILDPLGYYYAPDPSSGKASSIGGNIAENAGGPHCFKYGVTSNHVLGAEVVLPDGEVVWLGGKALDLPGYDLLGGFVGSEGTFGICTKAVLRILKKPEAVKTLLAIYDNIDDAARTVSAVVAAGMVPATLEMMDNLAIQAVEDSEALGFPRDAAAVLLIELDGLLDGMEDMAAQVLAMCQQNHAREVRVARCEDERIALWKGRKGAASAVARLAPNYLMLDGTVPRTKLPEAMRRVHEIGEKHNLRIAIVAHAGDGNLHPFVLFDSRIGADQERAMKAGMEILATCVELGGTITGEHGVGLEKVAAMSMIFAEPDLRAQEWLKEVFDPADLCNPGKVLPSRVAVRGSLMPPSHGDVQAELALLAPDASVDGDPQIAVAGVVPAVRVSPTTVQELAQIVGWASRRGMALAPLGGGTKLGIGNPPSRLDLVLDMAALDSVVEYDPENLVLTAQAGVRIHYIQSMVRKDSLVLPLDPQAGDRATLGGVLACADHGPRRRQYGGLRDVVLGLKVVLPDGSLASFGGRVLKNVAGYDLGKLFIGSLGTIGVIAEASVRLLPLSACEELLLMMPPDLEMGRRLAARIIESSLLPSALEFTSPACAGLLGLDPHFSLPDGAYLMLIALEGHSAAVERQVRDISLFCAELDLRKTTASEAGFPPDEGWRAFAGLREKALDSSTCVGLRCTAPLALAWDVAAAVEEHSRANGVSASYTMSCGTGYLETYAAGSPADLRTFAEAVRADAERRGGAMSVLHGWSALGNQFAAWGGHRSDYGLIRAVKQRFDPGGIMNPGRFVGGV